MNDKELKAIESELLKRIDKKSNVQLEKIKRYLNLIKIYYMLDKSINDLGVMVTTINGSQEFTKPNPAIAEKNKINSSLIALGKDLGLDVPITSTSSDEDNKSDLI